MLHGFSDRSWFPENVFVDRKAAHSVDDGLLTEEQFKVWKQNYAVPKEELKMLKPKSKFLSLSTEAEVRIYMHGIENK